jgi:hypothetical protein
MKSLSDTMTGYRLVLIEPTEGSSHHPVSLMVAY